MTKGKFIAHKEPKVTKMLNRYLVMDPAGTPSWLKTLDEDVNGLLSRWKVHEFHVNTEAYMGIVLECKSLKYGEAVIKVYPPILKEQYRREAYIYHKLERYHQCTLLDCSPDKRAILIRKVIPGDYISYPGDTDAIIRLFQDMKENRLPIISLEDLEPCIRSVLEQTEYEYVLSQKSGYHTELISYLMDNVREIYRDCFSCETKYLLHGDVYFRNALRDADGIQIIDPFGYKDAYVFEYMPFFTYELLLHSRPCDYFNDSQNLINFFAQFTDISKFHPAAFIFLVRQMIPSIREGNDNFKRADGYLTLIQALYLDEHGRLFADKVTPKNP